MRSFWGIFIFSSLFLVQAESACLYSHIQNAYEKNHLLNNIIEVLTKQTEIKSLEDITLGWPKAQEVVHKDCQVDQSFDLQKVVVQGASDFLLQVSGASYRLVQLRNPDGAIVTVLSKLSGNYQNEPILTIVRKNKIKDFVHVVGREYGSIKDTRYDFVFVGEESFLLHQSPRDYTRVDQIRSLKAIYGKPTTVIQPRAKVGVVGSGLDYNHPLLARFLGHREVIESDLQKIEVLRQQLRFDIFSSRDQLIQMKNQYLAMSNNVGFPRWADQALGTVEPMDRIIENGKVKLEGEHETRVTSRIVSDRDDVQVYFSRRMMGGQLDILDVKKVIKEFSKSGVQVVNLSFGSSCGSLPKEEEAWGKVFQEYSNMIFVVAAGNSGRNNDYVDHCPAKYSREFANVISVTSLDGDGNISVNVDPQTGRDLMVNYGLTVDVAIPADHLPVLVPFKYSGWINNEKGWTSLAAAEVSRVLVAAIADGYKVDSMTVKKKLQQTSQKRRQLKEFVGSGGRIDENAFRASLERF